MTSILFPKCPQQVPARGSVLSRALFKRLYSLAGWSVQGEIPDLPKAVAIFAPHTSNIDGWHAFLAIFGLGIQIQVLGKHSLFKPPFRHFLDWVGIMPVDRSSPHGLTQQVIQRIQTQDKIWVGIAPEGTRLHASKIRSGFYQIALGANVPIVIFSIDYQQKILYCRGHYHLTGDYESDLAHILQQYEDHFYPKHLHRLSVPLQKQLKSDAKTAYHLR